MRLFKNRCGIGTSRSTNFERVDESSSENSETYAMQSYAKTSCNSPGFESVGTIYKKETQIHFFRGWFIQCEYS